MKYKTNCNVVYSCKYHVVWCPKYRRKVLTDGVDIRLKELLLSYAANMNVDILEMEIMPDWECPSCHTVHDRDKNAAINILRKGLEKSA